MAEKEETEPQKRTIVIAMDGSDFSKYAFNWYAENMHRSDDNVIMVHVVEYHDVMHNAQWFYTPAVFDEQTMRDMIEAEAHTLRQELEHYAEIMRDAKVHGTVKSVHASKPGEGVIKEAVDRNATVIITGSRGKGKLRRTLIGSTSDYIMHHAHIPVIVCRSKELQDKHHHHFHLFGHHHHHHHHHDKEHHGSDERLHGKHHDNKHHDNKHGGSKEKMDTDHVS